jgi:pyruvate dehydrogenase E2 component (dihydrolipoamide acetyltransferase)
MQAVVMPKLGLTMTEGAIADWLKKPGDTVTVGEAIAEIETEKITYTLEAPVEGTLLKIIIPAGESAPVTQTIAWIGQPGEKVPEAEAEESAEQVPFTHVHGEPPKSAPADFTALVPSTPLAKKIARESSVNLGQVSGTGPNGRIQSADVEDFLRRLESAPKVTPAAAVVAEKLGVDAAMLHTSGERVRRVDVERYADRINTTSHSRLIPHSSMRKAIAKRMTESWTTIPHVTIQRIVSVTGMTDLQERASHHKGNKVSLTAVIAFLVSRILPKYPFLNAYYETDGCRVFDDVHLGIAVSVPNGLMVPVIRNADSKSIPELADEIVELSERARSGSLQPDKLEGGTFTISSLGMYGIDGFTPIIMPPQTGILGIGRIVRSVEPLGEETQNLASMTVSLSFDHRAADGVYGAQFLQTLAQCFEDPLRLFM